MKTKHPKKVCDPLAHLKSLRVQLIFWRPTDDAKIFIVGPRRAFGVILGRNKQALLAAFFERN